MSFWSQYRGRNTGRIYHFLHGYVSLDCAEHAIVNGDNRITYRGKRLATFTWMTDFGRGDVPVFTFEGEGSDRYAERQRAKQAHAISDGCAICPPDVAGRKPVDLEVMEAMLLDGTRSARIYGEGVHGAEPEFYVAKREIYFDTAGWTYRWDREIGGWLLWVEGERRKA